MKSLSTARPMSCKKCWKASHGSRRMSRSSATSTCSSASRCPVSAQRPVAVLPAAAAATVSAHGGYVGEGMLSAAVCGEVFTSPSTDAVLAAIRASAGPNGALLIVKNYTGDRLNFSSPPNSRAPKAFRSRRSSSPTT